ncbi:MAG: outer membrane protein assembly factor BamE [Burkholderiaceae bacterium]|jgi:outer membrane protein assembly factor BamE|nr:outer membrane protein assembly factor BamE [Burkholderiaceae bacterium]
MSELLQFHIRTVRAVALAALIAGLGGCGGFGSATRGVADALTLYQPEVVQGNFVSKEQVAALQPGMTRLQVRDALGTPLISSMFHGDRWDYVFTMKRQGVEAQSYHLTVFFKGDVMERFNGDEMPSENEFAQRISRKRQVKVPPLEATEAQLAKFPPAAGAPLAAASKPAAAAQSGSYPPLEPEPAR